MMKLTVFAMSLGLFVILSIPPSSADSLTWQNFYIFCQRVARAGDVAGSFDQCVGNARDNDEKVDSCVIQTVNTYEVNITDACYGSHLKTYIDEYKRRFGEMAENQIPHLLTTPVNVTSINTVCHSQSPIVEPFVYMCPNTKDHDQYVNFTYLSIFWKFYIISIVSVNALKGLLREKFGGR